MRIALCFQDGNFVGREYRARLMEAGWRPDLIVSIGTMKVESVAIERERTGGLWNPPLIPKRDSVRQFARLSDPELPELFRANSIDIAVQGGVGVLKGDILSAPRIGWLNVHPGHLPRYRGNSCPEWAVLNGDPVVATAHLIDEGIDTGPIVCAEEYIIQPNWSYFDFRARLYSHCAKVLINALTLLAAAEDDGRKIARPQSHAGAHYWPALGDKERVAVRQRFPLIGQD